MGIYYRGKRTIQFFQLVAKNLVTTAQRTHVHLNRDKIVIILQGNIVYGEKHSKPT